MKIALSILLVFLVPSFAFAQKSKATAKDQTWKTQERKLDDGVKLTADIYRLPAGEESAPPAPVVVCFHMAGGSRAEYRELAPAFAKLGCHVVAVDLRHGGPGEKFDRVTRKAYGTPNGTWESAKKKGFDTGRAASYPDMIAGVDWARELFPDSPVAIFGSSFSASLVLVYAAEHGEKIDAVFSFSPAANYIQGMEVLKRIKPLKVPTYITCSGIKNEHTAAKKLAKELDEKWLTLVLPEGNAAHGSPTLITANKETRDEQWKPIRTQLKKLRVAARTAHEEAQKEPAQD